MQWKNTCLVASFFGSALFLNLEQCRLHGTVSMLFQHKSKNQGIRQQLVKMFRCSVPQTRTQVIVAYLYPGLHVSRWSSIRTLQLMT
ncbi:uncharacterized protein EI90DRAFT_3044758 [Cantharellus anzutake]|uniref:uncharacterized protein n=1 Tax=Cantharellus anzutake TaxID=1750568 RepID=UPI0019045187|nr:uncharacterized protein EI90DRAFT_3044758 [Cantharellus anzutake]KAF8337063.1 hypothetical protein EI90DRAFT_3044758 [Cantharellus anzutake]